VNRNARRQGAVTDEESELDIRTGDWFATLPLDMFYSV
jgi:hypothetical protein